MTLRRVFVVSMTLLSCGHGAQPVSPAPPARVPARVEAAGVVASLPKESSPVTFERIARYPEPGWNVPRSIQHAPDGATITFLASESGDETMSLFANTAKLVDALIAKHTPFDLLVLPGERHGTRAPAAKSYVPERIVDFFVRELR